MMKFVDIVDALPHSLKWFSLPLNTVYENEMVNVQHYLFTHHTLFIFYAYPS